MCPKIAERGEDFHRHLRVDVFLVVRVNRCILEKGRGSVQIIVNALPEDIQLLLIQIQSNFQFQPSCRGLPYGTFQLPP